MKKRLAEFTDGVLETAISHWATGLIEILLVHRTAGDALSAADGLIENEGEAGVLDEDDLGKKEGEAILKWMSETVSLSTALVDLEYSKSEIDDLCQKSPAEFPREVYDKLFEYFQTYWVEM